MAILEKNNPGSWLNHNYPGVKEIKQNVSLQDSGNIPLQELVQAIEELKPDQGIRITAQLLPSNLGIKARRSYSVEEAPTPSQVWGYGRRIRIKDSERNAKWTKRKAREETFGIHKHTERTLRNIIEYGFENSPFLGFHVISPDGRSIYRPLVFNIRGKELADFLQHFPAQATEVFGERKVKFGDIWEDCYVTIPSRTESREYDVELKGLPADLKTDRDLLFSAPISMFINCQCKYSRLGRGFKRRYRKPEEFFCPHVVAAIELDAEHRKKVYGEVKQAENELRELKRTARTQESEERIKNLETFIEENKRSVRLLADVTYSPGGKLTYLNDLLDWKAVVRDGKKDRRLHEVEHEIILNAAMLRYFSQDGYRETLNCESRNHLIHFLKNPYSISFRGLIKLDNSDNNH